MALASAPSATSHAIDMNPSLTTRQIWTDTFTSQRPPANASPEWTSMFTKHQVLMRALFDHPAMAPNRQQTFADPANKNKVYFCWDFVGRTLWFIDRTPVQLRNLDGEDADRWADVRSRTALVTSLILDEMPGFLDTMTEQTYPGLAGAHPSMGEEVLSAARALI